MRGLTSAEADVLRTVRAQIPGRTADAGEVLAVLSLAAAGRLRLVPGCRCDPSADYHAELTPAGREALRLHEVSLLGAVSP